MIPKIIHNIWIQGYENLPEKNKMNHVHIKKLNPDWEFIVWDNKIILDLLKKYPKLLHLYKNVNQLTGIIHSKTTQSDIARYVIMKEYGGLYYDMEYECVSSFNELFSGEKKDAKNAIYIASSKIEFLELFRSFGNIFSLPMYCSCFMAFQKDHPVWKKVFKKIENMSSKYLINGALDQTLQESEYPIILLDRIGGQFVCSNTNKICFTPFHILNGTPFGVTLDVKEQQLPINELNEDASLEACPISNLHRCKPFLEESSWKPIRPFLQFFNCYYKQIFLFFFVFVIIFIVERINHFNVIKFGLTTFIPGLAPPTVNDSPPAKASPSANASKAKKTKK